jgi:hypothetical protein
VPLFNEGDAEALVERPHFVRQSRSEDEEGESSAYRIAFIHDSPSFLATL